MNVDYIVVHCSDTPNGRHHDANDIRLWHMRGNGWDDIGYHYVIQISGEVERGRNHDTPGAHVRGYNDRSLGICLIGRDEFTEAQMRSLEAIVIMLKSQWSNADIVGHTDLDKAKTCPNLNVLEWWNDVRHRAIDL